MLFTSNNTLFGGGGGGDGDGGAVLWYNGYRTETNSSPVYGTPVHRNPCRSNEESFTKAFKRCWVNFMNVLFKMGIG